MGFCEKHQVQKLPKELERGYSMMVCPKCEEKERDRFSKLLTPAKTGEQVAAELYRFATKQLSD